MATLWIWSRRWWRGAKTICICIRICICISVCGVVTWSGKGFQVPKQSSCLWLASQRITGTIRQRLVSSNQALPTELANVNVRSILSTSIYLQFYSSTLIPSGLCQRFLPIFHTLHNIRVYEKQSSSPCKTWTFFLVCPERCSFHIKLCLLVFLWTYLNGPTLNVICSLYLHLWQYLYLVGRVKVDIEQTDFLRSWPTPWLRCVRQSVYSG